MPCDCRLEAKEVMQNRVLLALLTISAAMFCAELVAGMLANSIALLADSPDMLADATICGIALYAVGKSNSMKRRAAFVSGIFQCVLGLLVAGDVIRRFTFDRDPLTKRKKP
jgi:Co/Zn/Cd efflux system component